MGPSCGDFPARRGAGTFVFFAGLSSPVLALELAIQAVHAGLLIWIGWRLFARRSKPVFLIAAALIVQLSFSSLQLENFIWAADPGYLLVWTTATGAFLLLAARRVGGSVLLGVVSTLSCPNGVFVWPVLILQARVLRLSMRVRGLLTPGRRGDDRNLFLEIRSGPGAGDGCRPGPPASGSKHPDRRHAGGRDAHIRIGPLRDGRRMRSAGVRGLHHGEIPRAIGRRLLRPSMLRWPYLLY